MNCVVTVSDVTMNSFILVYMYRYRNKDMCVHIFSGSMFVRHYKCDPGSKQHNLVPSSWFLNSIFQ